MSQAATATPLVWDVELGCSRSRTKSFSQSRVRKRFAEKENSQYEFNKNKRLEVFQRREELLQKQVNIVATKLARSKSIAKRLKKEREAKSAILRMTISNKLERANCRRSNIIEKKKAKACTEYVSVRCLKVKKAKRLQRWWRHEKVIFSRIQRLLNSNAERKLYEVLSPFKENTNEQVIDFDHIAMHLANPNILSSAQEVIELTCLPPNKKVKVSTVRSALAAFMINRHPDIVLGPRLTDENECDAKRRRLERMSKILELRLMALLDSLEKKSRQNFNILMLRASRRIYNESFREWKEADAKRIGDELLEAFVSINQNHKETLEELERGSYEDPGLQQFNEGFEKQLESIKLKALKLLGRQGYQLWFQRAKAQLKQLEEQEQEQEQEPDQELEPEPATEAEAKATAESSVEYSLPQPTNSILPSNEKMAYELMLDPEFKLKGPSTESVNVLSDIIKGNDEDGTKDIYEKFSSQLKEGNYEKFINVLGNIRTRLSQLTPNRPDLAKQINESVDEELIVQQLEYKAFDKTSLYNIISFIGERIILLQAPARNAGTQLWLHELNQANELTSNDWQTLAPPALNFALNEISQIELDMANFQLSLLSRHIQGENGVLYQRNSFQKLIDSGEYRCGNSKIPLNTEEWILENKGNNPSLIGCVRDGIANLICLEFDHPLEMIQKMPETLRRFDIERFLRLNATIKRLTTGVVLEVIFKQALGERPKPEFVSGLLERLRVMLENPDVSVQDLEIEMLSRAKEAIKNLTTTQEENLVSLVRQNQKSTLFKTVLRRFESFLKLSMKDGFQEHNVKKLGLSSWTIEAKELFEEVFKVFNLNMSIYQTFYEKAYRMNVE